MSDDLDAARGISYGLALSMLLYAAAALSVLWFARLLW